MSVLKIDVRIVYVVWVVITCLGIFGGYLLGLNHNNNDSVEGVVYSKLMFSIDDVDWGVGANGFYSYDGYFCVMTKDRSLEEITRVTMHELAHLFVHESYDHYCNNDIKSYNEVFSK
jgi:Zn-dependent peptidase ImmA (M78 family)